MEGGDRGGGGGGWREGTMEGRACQKGLDEWERLAGAGWRGRAGRWLAVRCRVSIGLMTIPMRDR